MVQKSEDSDSLKEQAERAAAMLGTHNQARQGDVGQQAPTRSSQPMTIGAFIMKNLMYILSVAVVVVVATVALIVMAPFMMEPTDQQLEESYVSPYDWSKLSRTGGRFAYVEGGGVQSRLGIDVSENQHWINWPAVASDGIQFAMVRLGYRGATAGDLYMDEYYEANITGAFDAGLDVGVYFFSQAKTPEEAVQEADFVLANLGSVPLAYPIAFDSEERVAGIAESRTSGLSIDEMTAIAEAFCDRIEAAGFSTMVYGNANDLSRYRRTILEDDLIWWAEYGTPTPTAKLDIEMWQYTNGGVVAGIDGNVDMNIDLAPALEAEEPQEEDQR